MNLTYVDGLCLRMRGKIRCGDGERLLEHPFLAECGGSILDIKRVWVPASCAACQFFDDHLNIPVTQQTDVIEGEQEYSTVKLIGKFGKVENLGDVYAGQCFRLFS